jgi:hypothetical protein
MICLICAGLLAVILPQPALAQQAEWRLYKTYIISWYSNPYGKFTLYVDIYKLINDGNTALDFYMIKSRLQTVPGKLVYASDWRTDFTWNYHYIRQYYSYQYLAGYAPTTAPGSQTSGWTFNVAGTLGWSGTGPVASVTVGGGIVNTWTSSDAMVKDQSDFVSHQACWWWDINEGANVGMNTFLSESAYVLMTYEGYSIKVGLNWGVQWLKPEPWPYPPSTYLISLSTYITYP